jgi:hypothetical protein
MKKKKLCSAKAICQSSIFYFFPSKNIWANTHFTSST